MRFDGWKDNTRGEKDESRSRERKDAEEGDREYERFTAGSVLHK